MKRSSILLSSLAAVAAGMPMANIDMEISRGPYGNGRNWKQQRWAVRGSTWQPKKKRNRRGRDPHGRSGYLS